jgi:hypothetical protein
MFYYLQPWSNILINLCSKTCKVFQGETENDAFTSLYALKLQTRKEGMKQAGERFHATHL